jgi:hypothetical protein
MRGNKAYRQLPGYLKEHYQIVLTERMVRLELEGEEINLFARGKKGGQDLLVVGRCPYPPQRDFLPSALYLHRGSTG